MTPPTPKKMLDGELHIRRFRMFHDLTIPKLGMLNLIVGRNGTGKSSVLEAVALLATNGANWVFGEILEGRGENLQRPVFPESSPLFSFVHRETPNSKGFELSAGVRKLAASAEYAEVTEWEKQNWGADPKPRTTDFDDRQTRLRLTWQDEGQRTIPLDRPLFRGAGAVSDDFLLGCVMVGTSGVGIKELASLWNGVNLTDLEDRINRMMGECFPEIERVSVSISDGSAVAKVRGVKRPVTLKSLGEGASRLFSLALAAANAHDGVLLIDEVEIGIHYTLQLELWRFLASLSKEFNVQIFATTHSEDAVNAFGIVLQEDPESDGQLVRLQSRRGVIQAVSFDTDELDHARESGSELR